MQNALEHDGDRGSILKELRLHALVLFGFIGVIWLVEAVDFVVFGGGLDAMGIRPRLLAGLPGILAAPFLHGGLSHLAANTLPFLVLGGLIMLKETWHFFAVSAITVVLGGLGVWLIGPSGSVHIGASGLIFGYFGYLLLSGWFDRKLSTILLSVFVALTYGGLIFGVLPGQLGVSWQSHLFGFLAGALAARLLARRATPAEAS